MTSKSSTIRRLVKRERTHRIPFSENCLRRDRSLSSCLIHSYSSFSLSFSTRNPVSPSFTISGGQQQRVALARAIVIRPQVLLMDEPLSNLDAKLRIEMRNAIKQIQRRVDITTVYVTHDQEEALAVSDRIAVMNGGVICQIGRPADIYKRPKNVFVSTFIGLSNLLDGHIVKKGDKTSISFKENEDWLVDMDNLSGGVEDGEEVIISVRPEEFNMEPGTKEGIRGVIRSSVFLGLTTHYFITTDGGQELEILQTQEGQDILPDGSAVTLTVKAGRINVFRRATEETLIREEGL